MAKKGSGKMPAGGKGKMPTGGKGNPTIMKMRADRKAQADKLTKKITDIMSTTHDGDREQMYISLLTKGVKK